MAYANLTPNLQDMFNQINDRLRKLESGPNSAQYSADSAQSTANAAYSQAVAASAQATAAALQAGIASQSASGKNSVNYATYAPSTYSNNTNGTTPITGDVWFYVNGSGSVLYQYVYGSGGWTVAPITDTVIANLTAGKISAGTITAAVGITSPSGNFSLNSTTGALIATNANIQGTVTASSGSFTGSLYSSSGTIGGFNLSSYSLSNSSGTIELLSSGNGQISLSGEIFAGSVNIGGQTPPTNGLGVYGASTFGGYIYNTGYATTTSSANAYINSSTGLLARSSSSLRYKLDVEPQVIPVQSILQLQPKSFIDKASADAQDGKTDGLPRILGLIAEEIAQIPVLADLLMNKNEQGEPDSVNYDRIAVALLPLLQDHEARLAKLEGK
jgi:hypothetical protein